MHNSGGLLNLLVGGIIQDTLMYRSKIEPMVEGDTPPQAFAPSKLDQTDILFGFMGQEGSATAA